MPSRAAAAAEELASPKVDGWRRDEEDNELMHIDYEELREAGILLKTGERVNGSGFRNDVVSLLTQAPVRRAASPTQLARENESLNMINFVAQSSPTPGDLAINFNIGSLGDKEQDKELVEGFAAALELTEPEAKNSIGEAKQTSHPVKVAALKPQPDATARARVPPSGISSHEFSMRGTDSTERLRVPIRDESIREVPLRITGMVGAFQRASTSAPVFTPSSFPRFGKGKAEMPLHVGQRPRSLAKKKMPEKKNVLENPQSLLLCGQEKHLQKK